MDDREVNEQELREQALAELRKRHDLGAHVLAYLMVNSFLTAIWWVTGAGFFWPVFPLFGWGIGLIFHAWDVFWPTPDQNRIQAEMDRLAHR